MVSTGGYKTTQNLGTNHTYGDASVNSGVGTMFQNARSTLDSQVQTNLTSFNQSLEGLIHDLEHGAKMQSAAANINDTFPLKSKGATYTVSDFNFSGKIDA